jgi:hypothetical protein
VRKLNSEAHTLPQYQQMKASDKDRIGAALDVAPSIRVDFSYATMLKIFSTQKAVTLP